MNNYVLIFAFLCGCTSVSNAGEIGNLFSPSNPSVDVRSRDASATALKGVQSIILAIEHSELRQLDARKESLASASTILENAATKMQSIEITDDINLPIQVDGVPENEREYLLYIRQNYLSEKGFPSNVKELYGDFIKLTSELSATVRDAATSNDPVLSKEVIDGTARYLAIGGIISRVISATLRRVSP